jgi:hypothetical protein
MADAVPLASLDDNFAMTVLFDDISGKRTFQTEATWAQIFSLIAPKLGQRPTDGAVNAAFGMAMYRRAHPGAVLSSIASAVIQAEDFETIRIQLLSLGLIETKVLLTTSGRNEIFWSLTSRGERLMFQLRTIKKTPS